MADEAKTPLDQAIDLLVYAPVGLALTVRDELPRLVARGRAQVTGQLALAKMFGQFAVAQGQKEAQKAADKLVKQAGERLAGSPTPGPRPTSSPVPAPAAAGTAPPPVQTRPPAGNGTATNAATVTNPGNGRQTAGAAGAASSVRAVVGPAKTADLAIPGYDTLSASQVVQRLAGLSAEELEAVRAYETSTRSRRTILSKVAQLQIGH